ncbi:glutamate--cysteine ligase [Neomegalonema perideroedes]|uniref:glutamate--cysteine ligase n=1 Tax=Neomegalonema perideroedes TaxID=217219 RepID=UPI00036CC092|nr:glutamate--cysteine ligase [Neomegalonema perideroedes]
MSIPQQGGGLIESRAQLAAYLEAGCKPRSAWRIGTEHEKIGFRQADLSPVPYEGETGIRALLEGLKSRFGWEGLYEGEILVGLKRGAENVSLEPGGQLELSGAPLRSLHEARTELENHLEEVRAVAGPMGLNFLTLGASPLWSRAETPVMPKGRYGLMTRHMPKVGGSGLDMMFRSCTVQVNLDFESESDMARKLRVGFALQPLATAWFANSPFTENKLNGYESWRGAIWADTDPARTGIPAFAFEGSGASFEAWVDYALDTPMYFVYREGRYVDALGQSFRDFLAGRLPALPGERPTLSDWADHLTTLFPDVRLKKFIEMRGADVGDAAHILALPALWTGLLYDSAALDAAFDLVKDWTHAEVLALRAAVPAQGMAAKIGGRDLWSVADEVLALAEAGLNARAAEFGAGASEAAYLAPLRGMLERRETAAGRLIRLYKTEWRESVRPAFQTEVFF